MRGDLTIENPSNVHDDVRVPDFNTNTASEEQRTTEKIDFHEREDVAPFSVQKSDQIFY